MFFPSYFSCLANCEIVIVDRNKERMYYNYSCVIEDMYDNILTSARVTRNVTNEFSFRLT